MGIDSLGLVLEGFGFTRQDYYAFPRKQLVATWFAPPAGDYEHLPRVFVSELQVWVAWRGGWMCGGEAGSNERMAAGRAVGRSNAVG